MAQTALEVANAALYKLGATVIAQVTAPPASTAPKEEVACCARLEPCKRALLRMHPWNFATKRKVILPPASFAVSNVTWVSSQLIEVTHATAAYVTGQYVTVASVDGATLANGTFEIQSAVGVTVSRLTVPLATTSAILGTYTTGGTIRRSPAFDYAYLYTLPTDCLRLLTIDDQASWADRWKVEGRNLLSDESVSLPIKFIYDVTDYDLMDIEFYECLATYMAWDICDHITGDDNKKRSLWTDLHGGDGKVGLLPRSRFADATEDSQEEMTANTWLAARGGGVAPMYLG